MRILKIGFKNINALKGEWKIDFTESPFKEAGIFAITGPNGSGKTTIMDSISLALYGKTTRLSSPAGQIISKDENECYSEVVFAVNGSTYLSRWDAKKENGSFPVNMKLVKLNGDETVIKDKVNTVPGEIAEITGLDFKRFSRSVMLAQGEFAAFLKALDNERAEILEKIMGSGIYEEYKKSCRENSDKENEKLLLLKEKVQSFDIMDSSAEARLKEELSALEDEKKEILQNLRSLKEEKNKQKNLLDLKDKLEDRQIALSSALAVKEEMAADIKKLENAKKAAFMEDEIKNLSELGLLKTEKSEDLDRAGEEIATLTARLDNLKNDRKITQNALDSAQKALLDRKELLDKIIAMDKQSETAANIFREKVEQYESCEKEIKEKVKSRSNINERIEEAKKELEKVSIWLEERSEIEDEKNNIPAIYKGFKDAENLKIQKKELDAKRKGAAKAEKKSGKILKKAENCVARLEKLVKELEKIKSGHEESARSLLEGKSRDDFVKEYEAGKKLMANYTAMVKTGKKYARQEKKNGAKLVKSLKQAETEHTKLADDLKTEKERLKELKKALKDQRKKVKSMRKRSKALARDMKILKKRQEKIGKTKETWKELCIACGREYEIEDRKSIKAAAKDVKKTVKAKKQKFKKLAAHEKSIKKIDKSLGKKRKKLTDKLMSIDELKTNYNIDKNILLALDKEIADNKKAREARDRELKNKLALYGEKMPKPGETQSLSRKLEAGKQEYEKKLKHKDELEIKVKNLENEAKSLPDDIESLKNKAGAMKKEVESCQNKMNELKEKREKAFGSVNAIKEKQELEDEIKTNDENLKKIVEEIESSKKSLLAGKAGKEKLEKEVKDLENQFDDLERRLKNKALAAGFATIDEARKAILPAAVCEETEKKQKESESKIEKCRKELDEVKNMLGETSMESISQSSFDDIERQINDYEKELENLEIKTGHMENTLKTHEAEKEEYEKLLKETENQEKICDKHNKEMEFLESGSDPEVKKKIRGIMLDRLLEESNRQLEELSGRYYIRRNSNTDEGLGLEIEDTALGRAKRTIDTLSGGEAFLISLSLALGLSDIAKTDRKIESLFIDEGFGSLDEETLYKVLAMLKNLKANGKIVGVISHVKKLAEEIPTQIKLSKIPGGLSRIEVMA